MWVEGEGDTEEGGQRQRSGGEAWEEAWEEEMAKERKEEEGVELGEERGVLGFFGEAGLVLLSVSAAEEEVVVAVVAVVMMPWSSFFLSCAGNKVLRV